MNKKKFNKILLFQLIITFFIILGISFLSTVLDGDWRQYLPMRALIIVLGTIFICLLIGLPIRFNTKINTWWIHHQLVSLAGIVCGVIMLFFSWLPNFREVETYYDIVMVRPHSFLSITGWFLTAFCLLHLYPSPVFKAWVTRVLASGRSQEDVPGPRQ